MQAERQAPLVMEALRWLALLQDADATEQERRDFTAWLAQDPAHEAAWRRAQQVWRQAGALEPVLRGGADPARPGFRPAPTRRRWMRAAAAAALVAGGGGYLLGRADLLADYRTGIGERRSLALADGSTVELGSATALSFAFGRQSRLARLHKGEAFFTVAADAARPFLVAAAGGETRALGTVFDVKRLGDDVTVAVAEHAVAVSMPGSEPLIVRLGQSLRYGPDGLGEVRAADLAAVQAWRRDRLVFQEAPLAEVVAELERYLGGRVVITDRRIGGMPVTAVFDTRQADAALETIARTLPVRLRRLTGLLAFLSPAG